MERCGNKKLSRETLILPVKANTEIKEGMLVVLDATGYAIPGKKAEGVIAAGVSQAYVNNIGADGAEQILVHRGAFVLESDNIENTDLLKECYIKDSYTVTMTPTGTSIAGKILAVESDGVTVEIL